jgi:hypothetical protein
MYILFVVILTGNYNLHSISCRDELVTKLYVVMNSKIDLTVAQRHIKGKNFEFLSSHISKVVCVRRYLTIM